MVELRRLELDFVQAHYFQIFAMNDPAFTSVNTRFRRWTGSSAGRQNMVHLSLSSWTLACGCFQRMVPLGQNKAVKGSCLANKRSADIPGDETDRARGGPPP
jgi:hypothetical protein